MQPVATEERVLGDGLLRRRRAGHGATRDPAPGADEVERVLGADLGADHGGDHVDLAARYVEPQRLRGRRRELRQAEGPTVRQIVLHPALGDAERVHGRLLVAVHAHLVLEAGERGGGADGEEPDHEERDRQSEAIP